MHPDKFKAQNLTDWNDIRQCDLLKEFHIAYHFPKSLSIKKTHKNPTTEM